MHEARALGVALHPKGQEIPRTMCVDLILTCGWMDLRGTSSYRYIAAQVCLLKEMKPLVFCREVLAEILMLAAVQEHVQSAAFILHQVRSCEELLRTREKIGCGLHSAEMKRGTQGGFALAPPVLWF